MSAAASKAVPRELEAAPVEAEGEGDIVGEVAVVDEAGRQPLGLDRVAHAQLLGDFLEGVLLPVQVDEPLVEAGGVGGGAPYAGAHPDRAAEDRGALAELVCRDRESLRVADVRAHALH